MHLLIKDNMRENIKSILERLYVAHGITFYSFNSEGELIARVGKIDDSYDPLHTDSEFLQKLLAMCKGREYPIIEIEEDVFIFGAYQDNTGNYYICGPAVIGDASISHLHRYRMKHHINGKDNYFPHKTYTDMANALSLILLIIGNTVVSEDEVLARNQYGNAYVPMPDYEFHHYRFERSGEQKAYDDLDERQLFDALERGDVDYFRKGEPVDPEILNKVGKFAQNNRKQMEYMCVNSICLACRAAVRGGLSPSIAYEMNDLYLQKLEKCTKIEEMITLNGNMLWDYVYHVREAKEKSRGSGYVEKCKDLIVQGIHHPLKLGEIAKKIGVNPSYLSRKFSEEVGITIREYNIKARLEAATNFLKYSEFSITEIAEYLCFSSTSRLVSQFKQEYGTTPMKYRRDHQVISFISKNGIRGKEKDIKVK